MIRIYVDPSGLKGRLLMMGVCTRLRSIVSSTL
jgi:hypothetical protein